MARYSVVVIFATKYVQMVLISMPKNEKLHNTFKSHFLQNQNKRRKIWTAILHVGCSCNVHKYCNGYFS